MYQWSEGDKNLKLKNLFDKKSLEIIWIIQVSRYNPKNTVKIEELKTCRSYLYFEHRWNWRMEDLIVMTDNGGGWLSSKKLKLRGVNITRRRMNHRLSSMHCRIAGVVVGIGSGVIAGVAAPLLLMYTGSALLRFIYFYRTERDG